MTTPNESAADAPTPEKQKAEAPLILRGIDKSGEANVLVFAHAEGAKTPAHGMLNFGDGKLNGTFWFNFNEKTGKKSMSFSVYEEGKDGAEGGWVTKAYGNAVNTDSRADQPVYFDTVVFNEAGGKRTVSARITKAGEAFAEKIGFTSARVPRPAKEKADGEGEAASADRPRGG